MKYFNWNNDKNDKLKKERGISFEEIVFWIIHDGLLDVVEHPNKAKYPDQKILVVRAYNYVHLVPFVENDEEIFLKTIIPNRAMTRKYLGDEDETD